MNSMDYFFKLQRSQENDTSDYELLKKKAEESDATLAMAQNQKEQQLSHLRARIDVLEAQLSRDASVAQTKISDLETVIAVNNTAIQNLQQELSSVKIQAELDSKASKVRISHLFEEAASQRSKA
jgi:mannitol-specific phosphotransferase system IIBC component